MHAHARCTHIHTHALTRTHACTHVRAPHAGATLKWNSTGTALLVLSYADYDATNQSYYGEQKLHYMAADPAKVRAGAYV